MKKHRVNNRLTACAIGATLAATIVGNPAHATNGYFANGFGTESKGLAGSSVAVDTGVMGLSQNPALGTRVGRGAEACLSFFAPDRGFTVGGAGPLIPGSYESDNNLFLVPCGGANFQLNDRSTLGFSLYGNGGMNTEYPVNTFAGLGAGTAPLGVNLEQLFMSVNYSFDVNDQFSIGIAPVFAIQRFQATGLQAFGAFSTNPGALTNNGDDWSTGFGLNLGLVWQPSDEWTIGAAYRTKMEMDEFDRYAGLFAEQGDFDIPATATLGAAFSPAANPALTLTAEYQRIFYSDVASIANSGAVIATPLGAPNGPGFGWDDMDVIRVGGIYQVDSKLTLRGGISYATDFIESNEVLLNTLAPATINWHASIGASYALNDQWTLSGAYTHAFESDISGANQTPGFGQPINLRMSQNELTVGFSYNW